VKYHLVARKFEDNARRAADPRGAGLGIESQSVIGLVGGRAALNSSVLASTKGP
jgi:hypothetical protein